MHVRQSLRAAASMTEASHRVAQTPSVLNAALSISSLCCLRLRKSARRSEKLDPMLRRERGDRDDLLLARGVAGRRKRLPIGWSACRKDKVLEVTRRADGEPACVAGALDAICMRHAFRAESDGSGCDPFRFIVADEEAHLSFEHIPCLVVLQVKMKRRHVPRRRGELDYGHLTGHLLRQADAYEVREEPARLCFVHHCKQR